jgi:hypothetical protein
MLGLTWMQARYTPFSPSTSEEFTSASRSVKPGLIASGIVSAWTWAASLVRLTLQSSLILSDPSIQLQSSAVAYKFGISGPWWYAGGNLISSFLSFSFTYNLSPRRNNPGPLIRPTCCKTQTQRTTRTYMAWDCGCTLGKRCPRRLPVLRPRDKYHCQLYVGPRRVRNGDRFNRNEYDCGVYERGHWCYIRSCLHARHVSLSLLELRYTL